VKRHRFRSLDDVESDLSKLKVKRWRRRANNIKKFPSLLKEAKVLRGKE
jgi:hypothetical protein